MWPEASSVRIVEKSNSLLRSINTIFCATNVQIRTTDVVLLYVNAALSCNRTYLYNLMFRCKKMFKYIYLHVFFIGFYNTLTVILYSCYTFIIIFSDIGNVKTADYHD